MNDILSLCGWQYKKKKGEIENIVSKMQVDDFENAKENNRCAWFEKFYNEIRQSALNYLY